LRSRRRRIRGIPVQIILRNVDIGGYSPNIIIGVIVATIEAIIANHQRHFFFNKSKRRPAKKKKNWMKRKAQKMGICNRNKPHPVIFSEVPKKNMKNTPTPPLSIIHQAAIFVFVGSETFSSIKLNFYFDLFIFAKSRTFFKN
jgi:hypothetical protein